MENKLDGITFEELAVLREQGFLPQDKIPNSIQTRKETKQQDILSNITNINESGELIPHITDLLREYGFRESSIILELRNDIASFVQGKNVTEMNQGQLEVFGEKLRDYQDEIEKSLHDSIPTESLILMLQTIVLFDQLDWPEEIQREWDECIDLAANL